jgi:hypothetical protein
MANQINEELNKKIDEVLASVEEQDERKLYDVFKYLCDSKFETKLSPKTIGQIINTVQYGLNRNYGMFRPYRSIYILIGELAPFHSEEIASIQNDITNYLNDDIFDYDEFTSVLYFFREAWKYLESVWSIENKAAIIENLIDIVEDEYESDGYFDAFIADNVLRALIVIEKDDPKAQKTKMG